MSMRKVPFLVALTEEQYNHMQRHAIKNGIAKADVCRIALTKYLEGENERNAEIRDKVNTTG